MKKLLTKSISMLILVLVISCSTDEPITLEVPSSVNASSTFALKINLSWSNVSNATGYRIFRSDFAALEADLKFKEIGTAETTTYTDLAVVSSTSYYYKIEAYNGSVSSEKSQSILGKTKVITLDESFDVLAEYTGGVRYNAANASQVPAAIVKIVNEHAQAGTDLVFLIDNTGSMGDDISQVRASINNIISKLPSSTRLGIATYNDENRISNWYRKSDLNTNYNLSKSFLNSIVASGGGDIPESVYHGIYLTVDEMSWSSSSKRIVIVIGDAPPLEGSRSKYSLKEVIDKCNALSISTNLFPILIRS